MRRQYRAEAIARVETEARAMAHSGLYRSHREIKNVLVERGLEATAKVFSNVWSQTEIDRLCRLARGNRELTGGAASNGSAQSGTLAK